ncbi:MAG: hypothetical protein J6T15_01400 [Bacilli bacterium]|nr:hypothetical protein [Bacilli bacterium]
MHKLLATSLLAVALMNSSVNNSASVKMVSTEMIGPFKEFDNDTTIKFSYRLGSTLSSIHEELYCYDATTGKSYSRSSKATHSAGTGTTTVQFPVSLSKYFSSNGLRFRFTIYNGSTVISTSEVSIYPMEQKTINVTGDKIKSVVSKDVAFKIDNNKIVTYHDDFNFIGFKDYIDADNYHSLDLRGNTFLYNNSNLNYSSASLEIADSNKVFKYLSHDSNGRVHINLAVTNDNEKKGLKVSDTYYVNPITLDIANYKMPDSIKSNSFYFPINKKKAFLGASFNITLADCGLNKYNLNFPITYDIYRNLVGNCYDSDYCVKGSVE